MDNLLTWHAHAVPVARFLHGQLVDLALYNDDRLAVDDVIDAVKQLLSPLHLKSRGGGEVIRMLG